MIGLNCFQAVSFRLVEDVGLAWSSWFYGN
jgi:hypothetical protein